MWLITPKKVYYEVHHPKLNQSKWLECKIFATCAEQDDAMDSNKGRSSGKQLQITKKDKKLLFINIYMLSN